MASSINRRDFIKKTGIVSAGIPLGLKLNSKKKQSELAKSDDKPHIIFIMTDQHRGDALGCAGNPSVISPNLDALANDGVVFTNGYSSTPSCTPARSALLTGFSPWHHGMLGYGRVAKKYKYEMPQMIRNAGYHTYGIGKMHWYPERIKHGFHDVLLDEASKVETPGFVSDYYQWFYEKAPNLKPRATGIGSNEHRAGTYLLAEDLHPTHWTAQMAVDKIQDHIEENPLFLKVSFVRPHSPYDPPKRFLDMYKDIDIPKPFIGEWAGDFADYPMKTNAWHGNFGEEHAIKARKAYYANITFIDEQVGRIIQTLKDKGMYDNSLIFFTSDHGDMLGDHHHWRKTYAYEGSAKIPFIMKWPKNENTKISAGQKLTHPVELRDVLPTCLDIIGEKVPEDMDGKSLMTLVKEDNPEWRPYIDMEHSACYEDDNYWCALTDGKEKYIYFFTTGQEQLFNLIDDKGEIKNLSEKIDSLATLKKWRQRMVDHLSERGEGFVKDNRLVIRTESMLYSPNYPDNEL